MFTRVTNIQFTYYDKRELLSIPFCVILLFACNNEDLSPEILGSSIESNHKRQELYIPYADSVELKALAQNKKVLDLNQREKLPYRNE